jgi:PAS domain S-box-containing protein
MHSIATTVPRGSSLLPPHLALRQHPPNHCVQFYEDDSALLETLGQTLGTAIVSGHSAIVIATKAHHEGLDAQFRSRGIDPALAIQQGRFLCLDAAETLSHFMVDDRPEPDLFKAYLGGMISLAESASRRQESPIVMFGEMGSMLWADERRDAALQLDQLWNQLATTHSFYLHCAYSMKLFDRESDNAFIREICGKHRTIIPAEQYTCAATEHDQMQAVVLLQQKACALETEVRERKKVEDASFRLAAIVESSDDAIVSKDLNGIINSWNQSAEHIFGFTAEEIIGKPILLLIPPELQDQEPRILSKIRSGERIDHFQTVRLTKSGERIDVSLTISPVKDRQGKIIGAAKIVRNITHQKKLEAALHTTERLASVGRLAATVAHEINNPLESVLNFVYLARQQPEISEQTESYLAAADKEVSRVAHIAQQTLGFYRDNSHPTSLDLTTVVREVVAIYESRARAKSLQLEMRVEPHLTIVALQGELKQIVSNLLANSIDACDRGSKIILECRRGVDPATGSRGVRITVADNGCGISAVDRERVFDPFFTTKKVVGTGLGLWITRDLLEKRGGNIRLRSSTNPARPGTVFRFFLPNPTFVS